MFIRGMAAVGASTAAISIPELLAGCTAPAGTSRSATPRSAPGPIRAQAGKLVDDQGNEVRLTGVNWFGMETSIFAPRGLWTRNWQDMLDQIVTTGFNAIRLPYSNELLQPASVPTSIDFAKNADLKGLNGLQVMDRIIDGAGRRHLVIVLGRHRPTADAQSELWYTDRVSERRWIDDWTMLAQRYRSQPAVIGADLHNEPHGSATWGDGNPRTDWRLAAQRAGNAILDANPHWLIIVEGTERFHNDSYWWGGNLEGARDHPIRLSRPDRLVYSAHDYGPEVYPQTWFEAPDFPKNLPSVWHRHWAWLHSEQVAPVLVGEFGGRSVGQDREGIWQHELVDFLKASGLSYTYWSWNPDSGDTGGILNDDWTTVDRAKLELLDGYQWPRMKSATADGVSSRDAA
ncbi:MAG TPA: glycoside hydrolase family 5 protein [Candidatus Dormibacteraeota bacterium]|nr:glycoside hydrolase family 5 protein [Candidatus Dormibacteraeota bacterium]